MIIIFFFADELLNDCQSLTDWHPDLIISKHGYKSISGIEGYLGGRHWTTILLEIHLLIFSLK